MKFSLVVLLMLFLLLAAWGSVLASTDSAKTVYETKCKMCHGSDGKAGTKSGRNDEICRLDSPFFMEAWHLSGGRQKLFPGRGQDAKI